mgnify:CR=1 FL=1
MKPHNIKHDKANTAPLGSKYTHALLHFQSIDKMNSKGLVSSTYPTPVACVPAGVAVSSETMLHRLVKRSNDVIATRRGWGCCRSTGSWRRSSWSSWSRAGSWRRSWIPVQAPLTSANPSRQTWVLSTLTLETITPLYVPVTLWSKVDSWFDLHRTMV